MKPTQEEIDAQRELIIAHAARLGYQPGTRAYLVLLDAALNRTNNDLDAAHRLIRRIPDVDPTE